jgi:hypothetical protein
MKTKVKCFSCKKNKVKQEFAMCKQCREELEALLTKPTECDARAKADYFSVGGSDF